MFIITGGGQGIGKALAHALVARQQSVLIIGRQEKALVETATSSSLISYLQADVSLAMDRQKIVEFLQDAPSISGLVNNAGIIEPMAPLTSVDADGWHQCLATNLDAPLFLTQRLLPKLQQGRVLNIGSGAAYFPIVGWTAYCVSKAGLSMLTRCWQLECPAVSFASVMPGIIDTNMQQKIRQAQHMAVEKRDFFNQLQQENKLLTTKTVAAFLCWLLLDVDKTTYSSKEWDIYDESHHMEWLKFPDAVPNIGTS